MAVGLVAAFVLGVAPGVSVPETILPGVSLPGVSLPGLSPAGAQVIGTTCVVNTVDRSDPDQLDADRGFQVAWSVPAGIGGDRVVIERRVDDTWHWRGRVESVEGAAPASNAFSFQDSGAPRGVDDAAVEYRVVVKDGDTELDSARCSVQFACEVGLVGVDYEVRWFGGLLASGAGGLGGNALDAVELDAVIERDVNPDDVYHWRGRVDVPAGATEGSFVDGGARNVPPEYRVILRRDRTPMAVADCSGAGALLERRSGADLVCPAPGATFVDTFGADRDGGARRHRGVDMFADRHSPVVAPEAGRVEFFTNRLGGRSFGLWGESGTWYYGAHLHDWVGADRDVVAGELIGTIGTTGNARATPPHLHFQIHPDGRGTDAVNPTGSVARACRPS